jgi:hypothetical protein
MGDRTMGRIICAVIAIVCSALALTMAVQYPDEVGDMGVMDALATVGAMMALTIKIIPMAVMGIFGASD